MVTKVYLNWQSKVTAIDISVSEINLKVDVWVSCVVNSIDFNNIGTIIESYRRYGLNDGFFISEPLLPLQFEFVGRVFQRGLQIVKCYL